MNMTTGNLYASLTLVTRRHAASKLFRDKNASSLNAVKRGSLITVFSLLLFLTPSQLGAQDNPGRFQVGADYNFVHANAPPGLCGCFNMNGGDAWLSWNFTDHISFVGQGALQHASHINGTTASLTLVSYLAGPRVTFRPTRRFVPFAQALLGGAHASGLLTPSQTTGLSGSANALAVSVGGGVDVMLTRALSLRAIQADYFYTRFANGGNNHQNNLRLSVGVLLRF